MSKQAQQAQKEYDTKIPQKGLNGQVASNNKCQQHINGSHEVRKNREDNSHNEDEDSNNSSVDGKKSRSRSRQSNDQEQQQQEEQLIMNMMGFSNFSSSKGKNHVRSAREAVLKNTTVRREYRQYMNRRGGFNRKLDKM